MLPDFRFVIGATLAAVVLGTAAFGLATAVRLTHQAKIGPLPLSRSLAFDQRADWNQFSDAELMRRFEGMERQSDTASSTPNVDTPSAGVPPPSGAAPRVEPPVPGPPALMAAPATAEPAIAQEQAIGSGPQPALEREPATTATVTAVQEAPVGAEISTENEPSPSQVPAASDNMSTAAIPAAAAPAPAVVAPENTESPAPEAPRATEHSTIMPAAAPAQMGKTEPAAPLPKAAPPRPRQLAKTAPNVTAAGGKAAAKPKPKIAVKKVRRARVRTAPISPATRDDSDPFAGFFQN